MEPTALLRRPSNRWLSEVHQLTRTQSIAKRLSMDLTPGRRQSMTSRSQHDRRLSFADVITPRRTLTARGAPVHPRMSHVSSTIVLVEKAREHVISTKLRRQKSDCEQEIKLAQIKRRRFAHHRHQTSDVDETRVTDAECVSPSFR